MHIKYSASSLLTLTCLLSCQSYPQGPPDEVEVEMPEPELLKFPSTDSRFKQEDADSESEPAETTPPAPSFGSQVAQIITGVATGNLGSILQGSFNLIPDPKVKEATNGAWETIAGITTPSTTTTTTTEAPTTPETPETTEAVEADTEETKTEGAIESTDAPEESSSSSKAPATNNEDDDDEEESRGEGIEEGEDAEAEDDTSVYSRSKVLRVV